MLATSDYGNELQEELNQIVGYDKKFNDAIVSHALDQKNAGIFQNPNSLNLTFQNVKKFDLTNPIICKIASQVKASKLTEDQLTKRILMQDEIANIENRLKQLKRPININNNSDDETGGPGGGSGRPGPGTPGSGPPPRYPDSIEDMTGRLNILCSICASSPSLQPPPPRDTTQEALQNRFNRIRYGPIELSPEEKLLNRRLSERQRDSKFQKV